ncbi:hypothetical protein [Streptomyces sp. NPDC042319]|uniref:hypothetical protein n=1 Tax=Streptomyces sp. NPDC042319 TaxID=3154332 RepID=UPI00340C66BA
MDARIPCIAHPESSDGGPAADTAVVLAELHPATLPSATDNATAVGGHSPGALDDGWAGFFHRAHRLLRADGLLLLATRQRRDAGNLTDPLGPLIACARTAGFRYLQHIVIVHGSPAGERILPAPPDASSPELMHSDLLVLSAITHA